MDRKLNSYLLNTLPKGPSWVLEMEKAAKENKVPIMDPLGMQFLMQLIRLKKPQQILEIGTAIGYSALRMSQANPLAKITTIEKDEIRYKEALEYIQAQRMQDKITVIHGDAIEVLNEFKKEAKFDMVFIDAAKGKYKQFFELSAKLLTSEGFIVTDNVLFKGYVADPVNDNSRHQQIANKIRGFNTWLTEHPDFTTSIMPVGDGVAISVKQ